MRMRFNKIERTALYIGWGITFLVMLARVMNIGQDLSLRSLDLLFHMRGPVEPTTPICIIAIDNESFNEMPERWIWPRSFHARLIRQIMRGKPKVIVFDMLFTEETASDPKQDAEFAAACRMAGNVIMGAELVTVLDKNFRYEELKLPIRVLRPAIASAGVVNTPRDNDAYCRRSSLWWKVNEERYFSLPVEALRRYLGIGKGEINIDSGAMEFGDRTIPTDSHNLMQINFCGPAKTFRTIPYYQVYKGMVDPGVFRDAIVLIGATAEDLHDTFHTPFSWRPFWSDDPSIAMPGVEIHANAIETIMTKKFIRSFGVFFYLFLIVVLGFIVSIVTIRAPMLLGLGAAILAGISITGVSIYLFLAKNELMEFVHFLYAIGFSFLGVTMYRVAVERKERLRMRNTFSRYLSPHVLIEILSKPPELGGVRREVTVLFSDIRGFTSMSEQMDARAVVDQLNEYLTEMVDAVLDNEGTLDKFVGDAVMAVYNSPMDQPDHPLRAVKTAWNMNERLKKLQTKWIAENKVPFKIGIGINTGEVIAGNMGSPSRMEFTVIGDNVNLASRIESATKELGATILMSDATLQRVKEYVEVKEHPPLKVKGKEKAVQLFELISLKESVLAVSAPAPQGKSRGK